MNKIDQGKYIGLRPDVEIKVTQTQEAKAFLESKEIAEIELDSESHPVFLAVLPLLNGTKTVASIITAVKPIGIAEEATISCLNFLLESGFVYQFSRLEDSYQAANYAWRTNEPQEILDQLAKVKVIVQGQQKFCTLIAEGLTKSGIESVKIIPNSANETEPNLTNINPEWEAWASQADLIILFGEPWQQVLAINAWCVKNHKPLIVGWWKNFTVSFGPVLVPRVTACQACIHERQGNIPYPDITPSDSQAGSVPMVLSAANLLAGIAIEFLSGAGLSRALTSIHEIDLRRASFTSYPALKNPRCRVCSRLKTWPEGSVIDA